MLIQVVLLGLFGVGIALASVLIGGAGILVLQVLRLGIKGKKKHDE